MFEDINILENSVALLINKASEKKSLQALRNHIEKIIISNDKAKRLLEFTKNSTFKFN